MLPIAAMTVIMAAITIINVTAPGLTSPLTWSMAPTPQALAPAIGVRLRASQFGPRRVGIVYPEPVRPSSVARMRNIAWDHSNGVATGPQRSTHSR